MRAAFRTRHDTIRTNLTAWRRWEGWRKSVPQEHTQTTERAGLSREAMDQLSFNSARRLLPTAAGVFGKSLPHRPIRHTRPPHVSPLPRGEELGLRTCQEASHGHHLGGVYGRRGRSRRAAWRPWGPKLLTITWEDLLRAGGPVVGKKVMVQGVSAPLANGTGSEQAPAETGGSRRRKDKRPSHRYR